MIHRERGHPPPPLRAHAVTRGARRIFWAACAAAWAVVAPAQAVDAARGRVLHESCLSCHGTSIYQPPQRKIDTYKKLAAEVERWNRSYNPKFTKSEIADIMAYLNETFYKFPVK
jgi:mono/diheme cytochrome c family protein